MLASDDVNDDDVPGYSPDGGAGLNFDFPYDSAVGVQGNLNSVITNLFYMNNMMHDIYAYYGFDEASGNFQETNYSGLGAGTDFVFADAQDGSGTNNANFGTPPEGSNPRMQMFLWSSSQPVGLVTVNSPASIAMSYGALEAGFGPSVPSTPLTENVVLLIDNDGDLNDGCGTIQNAAEMIGKIVLIRRGTCPFVQKIQAAQDAGAIAVIMMNNAGAPIQMGGSSTTITIPSVMISSTDGTTFTTTISNGDTINATLQNPGDITAYDSDLDNLIISHEYGHGISNRLTGGANNSNCLFNAEQMGEGWSDWLGLMITMKPTDLGADRRGVGTYVTGAPNNGTGIRPAPYSTSFSVNNFTYANTNSGVSQPHGIGFVWASMLWDMNWDLINEYGFDPNVKTGTGGNNIAMALVIEGMKLQPCAPGFVDGRDAILAADSLLYNGANHCLIWKAFARRGLGFSAEQGSSDDRADQVQAFDLPVECQANASVNESNIENVRIYPNPTKDVITIDMNGVKNIASIHITDLAGKTIFKTDSITTSTLKVDLSNYKSGVYLVQLTDKSGAKTVEIIKH